VVSALDDPNPDIAGEGYRRLRAKGIAVVTGIGAEEARRVHAGHVRRMREGRPHVMLKLAVSADGKAGLAGRRPVAITGEPARERVHRLRAMHDAVLIGVGTALADDPLLTCRLPGMANRSPVRVVLDSALRLPRDGKLARGAREVPLWIVAGPDAAPAREDALRQRGAEVLRVGGAGDRRELAATLQLLAARGITRLMVEGGPIVAAAFLAADLLDEAVLLRSPTTIGADGIDALDGLPLAALTRSPRLRSCGVETAGADSVETFERS
jgi:diaminohydroxyphosphoribosylaminopyrimidine deaminase/5-amino-6-(5-phosphoribosylamino)uracil reductase